MLKRAAMPDISFLRHLIKVLHHLRTNQSYQHAILTKALTDGYTPREVIH